MNIPQLDQLLLEGQGLFYHQASCQATQRGALLYRNQINCEENALFDLASVTKLFTTTMVLKAVDQGKMALYTTLLEGLEPLIGDQSVLSLKTRKRLAEITLEDALKHHSGLPAWYPFYSGKNFWETLNHILEEAPVISQTLYSDLNFILLGKVLENILDIPLNNQLDELNASLGTNFSYNPENCEKCIGTEYGNQIEMDMCKARGLDLLPIQGRSGWRNTQVQIKGQVNDGNAFYAFGGVSGHAGIFSTASDLLKLGELYLHSLQGNGPLPADLAKRALINQGEERGLGFDTGDIFPMGAGHTGFTGTAIYICPQKELCALLLASRLPLPGPPNMQEIRKKAFTILYKEGSTP